MVEPQINSVLQEEPSGVMISSDTLEKMINRRDPIEDVVDSLKGIRRDRLGNVMDTGKPLLNSTGIEAMVRKLKSFMNTNMLLTNMDERTVNSIVQKMGFVIIFDLSVHYKEYGLEDTSQMSDILWICLSNIIASMKSGQYGFMTRQVTPTFKRVENYSPERRSAMDFMPSFGHRGV